MAPGSEDTPGHPPSRVQVEERTPQRQTPTTYRPPRRPAYGDLLNDPRARRWLLRAAIAVAVGVVAGLLLGWRAGLVPALLAVVADVVYHTNKSSTIEPWRRLSSAERRTERQLKALERAGYRALHARAIPGSDAQIDHLVVGPTGVYAVDSERWDRRLPVRALSHRKLFHGPYNRKDRLDEARWEAAQAHELISAALGREITVRPSLAIYGPKIPWNVLTIRDVDVYTGQRLRKYLKRQPKILSQMDVARIAKVAENVLPPRY